MIYAIKIIDKLCDLELLYETLDFLEKRSKANNETTTLLKENMRNARRMLAKLTALDYKRMLPEQPHIETSDYTIAAQASIPPLEAPLRSLLDPWPTEVSKRTTDPTALSSTEILSAKISTLPLSDFHESEMSNTPTEASLRKDDLFESFRTKIDQNLSEDRPPTVISPYTPSDKSICKSFEDAQLIRNFQKSKGATPTSISASGSTNRAPLSVTRPTLSTSWTPTKSEIPSYSVPGLSSTSLDTAEAEHSTTSVTTSANSAENPAVRMTPVIASVTSLPGSGFDGPNQTTTPVITALTPSLGGQECKIMTIPVVSGIIAMPASHGENRMFLPLVASLAFLATKDGTEQPLPSISTPEAIELQTKPVISSLLSVNADDEQPARVLPLVTAMTPLSAPQGVSMMTTPAGSTALSLRVNAKESPMPVPVVASNTNLPIANPVQVTASSTTKPKISISSASTITRVPNVLKNANKYSKTPDPMRSHIKKGRNKITKSPSFENSKRVRRAKKIVSTFYFWHKGKLFSLLTNFCFQSTKNYCLKVQH
ncbi:unnamed protein product [Cylicostephanus goldi]|uniref:Uncharacterized protein n=1 Tax=Cylicostephanus goldi TaxID=71465 RepID=A0A3P6QLU2_CYLGO|nr:unnamed protein product [Cylicostephanus goldi]